MKSAMLYDKHCASCHQSNGKGDGTRFPPLENSEWVRGDKEKLIDIVVNGISGPITVNGVGYNGAMPANDFLNDEDIALILTYVRQNFRNNAGVIRAAEVRRVRGIGKEIETGSKTGVIESKGVDPVYKVSRLKKPLKIDADWDKSVWKEIKPISIGNYMGKIPKFRPTVEAKMMYDDENVYVIFRVKDRFVRSVVQEYNGNVSGDSCVEFFFSPDANLPLRYFNLEVNAGGTPLMFYVVQPFSDYKKLLPDEIRQIEIAHSLPEKIDPEITDPVTWTIEYRLPISVLRKYSNVSRPGLGVTWKANFYKTGSLTSNPNYITWALVDYPQPNFHLPEFFGTIRFQ